MLACNSAGMQMSKDSRWPTVMPWGVGQDKGVRIMNNGIGASVMVGWLAGLCVILSLLCGYVAGNGWIPVVVSATGLVAVVAREIYLWRRA